MHLMIQTNSLGKKVPLYKKNDGSIDIGWCAAQRSSIALFPHSDIYVFLELRSSCLSTLV